MAGQGNKMSIQKRRKVVNALIQIIQTIDLKLDAPVLADVLRGHVPLNDDEQPVMGAKDAAKYLGVAPKTLSMWRWKGLGGPPFLKHGSKVVYRRSDLSAFLKDAERSSTSHRPDRYEGRPARSR